MEGLGQGAYIVCAAGAAKHHLSSCDWGSRPHYVPVERAITTKVPDVSIADGEVLRIEVTDYADRLSREAATPFGVLLPGVYFRRPGRVNRSGGITAYEITIPRAQRLLIRWESSLKATDARGTALGLESDLLSALQTDGSGAAKLALRLD
ncbi:MAG: hypothetical protein CBB60_001920 [Armatimonadetes bacterium Cent15-Ar3]|nr:MAG: hypothetical protein CBB60_001920 [Armatimonadetes bacterium Cent15-Ar3]